MVTKRSNTKTHQKQQCSNENIFGNCTYDNDYQTEDIMVQWLI